MKLLIIGHRGSGKTSIGRMIQERTGMVPHDSSQFLLEQVVFPALKDVYGYQTPQDCYEDRDNHRQEWFDLIESFNNPPDRLTKEILAKGDIYAGMRSRNEFEGSYQHFDAIIWIDAEGRVSPEPSTSMELTPADSNYILNNRGALEDLSQEVDRLIEWLKWQSA